MYAEQAGTVGMVSLDYSQPSVNRGISRLTTLPLRTEGTLPSYPPSADREKSRLTTPSPRQQKVSYLATFSPPTEG